MASGLLFGILGTLLPFVVIGAIIAAAIRSRTDDDDADVPPGIGTARRLFLYGIGFVALAFAASGVALLIGGALDAATGSLLIDQSGTRVAVALSFATVGIPVWGVLVLLAQRSVTAHPVERRSQARRFYFSLARGVAITIVAFNAAEVLRVILQVSDFSGGPWGWLVAWAAVWLIHDRLAAAEPAESAVTSLLDRLYRYYATLLGLVFLLVGAVGAVSVPLQAAYDGLFRTTLVAGAWSEEWREMIALLAVGIVVWVPAWVMRLGRIDAGSPLWRVQVFLAGVLVAVMLTVGSAGTLVHLVLQWLIGVPEAARAANHFELLPGAIAIALVGLASWGYHHALLDETARIGEPRSEPERVYRYVLAGSGLVAVAAGVTQLIALLIEVIAGTDSVIVSGDGWWRNRIVLVLTLFAVGAPLWAYGWLRIQQAVRSGSAAEQQATSRRVDLFGIFGVAALVMLVNLTVVLFQVFEALLEDGLSSGLIRDVRWSIALVTVAGAIAGYHWLVLREDQSEREGAPEATPVRRREVTLVVAARRREGIVAALEGIEGVAVRTWEHLGDTGGALPASALEALIDEVTASEHSRLLLVVEGDVYQLTPFSV